MQHSTIRWATISTITAVRCWKAEACSTTRPQPCWTDGPQNEDGSYLKLKNIPLSYTLPVQSTYLQGITVWAGAENLFTITRYLGSDPDCITAGSQLLQGIDTGLLGNSRSVSLGVKINL